MLQATPSGRHLSVVVLMLGLAATAPLCAWEIRSIEGREYVAVREVARFYNLTEAAAEDANTRHYRNADTELTVAKNGRQVSINGIAHWLAFPLVESGDDYFLSRMDLGKTLEPALRPQFIPNFPRVNTVVLDAGHGGRDHGAIGPYESEKNFALDVARRVRDLLIKAGVRVLMTRNSDTFIALKDRAGVANRLKNAIFVSLHFNAADWNRSATGFEIFCVTPQGSPSTAYEGVRVRDMVAESGNEHDIHSFALANAIIHSLHGKLVMADRGVKRSRFAVLRLSKNPSVLVEGGFLTNAEDARKVASREWRDDYAEAIVRGILEYKKLAEQHLPPRQLAQYRGAPTRPAAISTATPSADVKLREMPAAAEH